VSHDLTVWGVRHQPHDAGALMLLEWDWTTSAIDPVADRGDTHRGIKRLNPRHKIPVLRTERLS